MSTTSASIGIDASGSTESIVSSSSAAAPTTTASTVAAVMETVKTIITSSSSTTSPTSPTTSTPGAADFAPTSSASINSESTSTTSHMLNVADLSASLQHFGIVDYIVFILMLVVCAIIGFYFGFVENRKKKKGFNEQRRGSEALDYLVGGRKMKVFPVSLSLVASFVSGISLLGTSTEIYVYGTQYAFILVTLAISGVISWYVFLPVFCNLQLTSTYEYFEMRYDKSIRLFGSVLFTIGTILWLPIVVYVPALAFNQVTGVNIHIITPIVCIVCIFYTCVGGLKAVIWTDVIQTIIMVGAIILVIIKGTVDVGGLATVWQRNFDSGRIELPAITWDPTVRMSMFSVLVGTSVHYTIYISCNQVSMQRYLSVPGLKEAKQSLLWFVVLVIMLLGCCMYNGLLLFAKYHDCDPLSTKLAKAKDQLVPLLVMDLLSVFPGIPGLFVAGVFSAALSSLSTGLNSLAAVFLEDYIKPFRKTPLTEYQTAVIMRASVVIIGILCIALVFVVEHLGTVIQVSMALGSISSGPLFGLFVIGLLIPWINSRSALSGSIISFCIMFCICFKGQNAIAAGELVYAEKPVSTIGCTYAFGNVSAPVVPTVYDESGKTLEQYLFHMSFALYATMGLSLTIIFSFISSIFFGFNKPSEMNQELFAHCIRRFIKPAEYEIVKTNEKAMFANIELKSSFNS